MRQPSTAASSGTSAFHREAKHLDGSDTLFDRISDLSLPAGYHDEPVAQLAGRMVANIVSRVAVLDRNT